MFMKAHEVNNRRITFGAPINFKWIAYCSFCSIKLAFLNITEDGTLNVIVSLMLLKNLTSIVGNFAYPMVFNRKVSVHIIDSQFKFLFHTTMVLIFYSVYKFFILLCLQPSLLKLLLVQHYPGNMYSFKNAMNESNISYDLPR